MMEKTHLSLRQILLQAAAAAGRQINEQTKAEQEEEEGGEEELVTYLKTQALATPGSFLTLLGRLGAQEDGQEDVPIVRIELVAAEIKTDEKQQERQ